MMDRQTVKVYVRAGDHEGERTIAFRPPKEVPQVQWLKQGFAIDGNSVVASITRATYVKYPDNPSGVKPLSVDTSRQLGFGSAPSPHLNESRISPAAANALSDENTLVKALAQVEGWLVELLGTFGYDVEFV